MEAFRYQAGRITEAFHDAATAAKCGALDAVERPASHPDVVAFRARQAAEFRAKNQDEADGNAKARAVLAALDAGTATQAQRDKVLAFLLRRILG